MFNFSITLGNTGNANFIRMFIIVLMNLNFIHTIHLMVLQTKQGGRFNDLSRNTKNMTKKEYQLDLTVSLALLRVLIRPGDPSGESV